MARPKDNTAKKPTEQVVAPRPRGKLGDLLTAIESKKGITLDEASTKLKWQPHTSRAAITRLRQRGYEIALQTEGTRRCYKIGSAS